MIWCVEDDASIRDIEVYALQSTGFEAKGFEDGTSFWEALRTGRPELVVLDVMLPGIDGMELLRRMRADAALSDIPVVMATANKEFELLRLFLSHPGTAFSRDQLMADVWGTDYCGETRTVDMHIRTLRQKLGAYGEKIETVRGVGYRMEGKA